MEMTTAKLILLRIYNITIGRFPLFTRLLRLMLLHALVYHKTDKYVASSNYFDWDDLIEDNEHPRS